MTSSDNMPAPDARGRYVTETVVEEVDNSRRRRILAAVLILLILALGVAGYFVTVMAKPAGAPKASLTPDGVEWIRSIYAWGKTPQTMLNNPVDAAVAPDGTIWTVSDKTTLVGFNANGTPKKVVAFTRGGKEGTVNSLEGMDVGPDGLIYLADYGNSKIVVVDENGRIQREIGVELPIEVAVNGDRIAVAAASGVAVLETDGTLIAKWGARGNRAGEFDLPHGIAWGADGNIYVSDTNNKRLKVYSPAGRPRWIYPKDRAFAKRTGLSTSAAPKGEKASGLQIPAGMTVDSAGRVVLVDPFEFRAISIDASGKKLGEGWGDYGRRDGMFAYPTGISYDKSRDYYVVADTANNRLQIVRFPGSGGNAVAGDLRRAFDGPIWLFALPFLFLLAALLIPFLRRRRRERAEQQRPAPALT